MRVFKVTPGKVTPGPRLLHVGPGFSLLHSVVIWSGEGWGWEQERYRALEPAAVGT